VASGAVEGSVELQRSDKIGPSGSDLLGDQRAHRLTANVRARNSQTFEKGDGVLGHLIDRVPRVRDLRLTGSAIVEQHAPELGRIRGNLVHPEARALSCSGDQE
jgi:hypothetical protein